MTSMTHKIRWILAGIVILGFFVILTLLVFKEMPEGNRELLLLVLGALIGAFTTIVGYYFGDSESAEHNQGRG